MGIQADSKKIIQHFFKKAIENENLLAQFTIDFTVLAEELSFESAGYCRVCCQYLRDTGRIDLNKMGDSQLITIRAAAIDFLEMT